MTPESFQINLTVVKYMYARSLASLHFSRWVLNIVGCLSIILAVQDLINYKNNQTIPLTDNLIVLGLSIVVVIYMIQRINHLTLHNMRFMHDISTLTAYLELRNQQIKNQQINGTCESIDEFVDKFGDELDKEIKNRYQIP